jgi:ribulose-phosphate 3-epimerase
MRLAPSVLAADLANIKDALAQIEASGSDLVHFDVMDGHFVPNLTFGPPVIVNARSHTKLAFDVHLMVSDPLPYVQQLNSVGLEMLSFQIEATRFAPRLIEEIRARSMRPSVALNPQTPLTSIEEILDLVDNVLIMSVDPGFGGQKFIQGVYSKIEKLAEYRDIHELVFTIQVDGGVNLNNINELAGIGVDIVVAGSAFFAAADRRAFAAAVSSAGTN